MAQSPNVLIIYSNYYEDITAGLMQGAVIELEKEDAQIHKIEVPGVLEIPAALVMAASKKRFDAYILLGCVIRGETTHYDIVANESARSIMDIIVDHSLCVGNGIQTVETREQAWARANVEDKNKGGGAATAALSMINVQKQLEDI